jgi:hypothetical protein
MRRGNALANQGLIGNALRWIERGSERVIKSLVLYRRIQEVKSEATAAKDDCTYRLLEQ